MLWGSRPDTVEGRLDRVEDFLENLRPSLQEESSQRIEDFKQYYTKSEINNFFHGTAGGRKLIRWDAIKGLPWVDVRQFGAKGDNSTDCTAAIQAAINSCSNGRLRIPPGTYLLSDDIAITDSLFFEGFGNAVLDFQDSGHGFVIDGAIPMLDIRGITFYRMNGIQDSGYSDNVIDDLSFVDNYVLDSERGILFKHKVVKSYIAANRFENLSTTAQWCVGVGLVNTSYTNEKQIIIANEFDGIDAQTAGNEAHAVIVFGKEAIITHNIVEDVTNSANEAGSEGIYTKCRYSNVSNNILIDAGEDDGFISIKGEPRSGDDDPIEGYGVVARNNVLLSTDDHDRGILIQNDDVFADGNILEGFGGTAIDISASDDTVGNIKIANNVVRNHTGIRAIWVRSGKLVTVSNNQVYELLATNGAIVNTIGIGVANVNAISDVIIEGNVCRCTTTDATTKIIGVYIETADGVDLDRLTIRNNHTYIDSTIGIDQYGVNLVGDGTITDLVITNNNCNDDMSHPFVLSKTITLDGFDIKNNTFWGKLTYLESVERYHTDHIMTNSGETATKTVQLPAAEPGLQYTFIRVATQSFRIDPDGTEIIRGGGAGKYLELDTDGDSVVLTCEVAGTWEIIGGHGTYVYEE